jgi:hypothetical protein
MMEQDDPAHISYANRQCVLDKDGNIGDRFKVTPLRSTLRRSKDGSWTFHFKDANKFPKEPPKNIGKITFCEAFAFVEERYAKRYNRTIDRSGDVYDALLDSGEGTLSERMAWQKLRDKIMQ